MTRSTEHPLVVHGSAAPTATHPPPGPPSRGPADAGPLPVREVPLAALRGFWRAVAAIRARPAVLVALTVLLVCTPVRNSDVSAAVHVTPPDLVSVVLVAAVIPQVLKGRRMPGGPLWATVAVFTVALGVATVASRDPATSVSGFVRYLQLFVVVPTAVVLALRQRRDLRLVCAALMAAAVIEGAIGTWQYLTGTGASFGGRDVRAVGTFGALDVMGMSTVVSYGLVVAVGLALVLRGRARAGLLALAALLAVPLLLSLSRGGVIATLGAVMVMLVAASPRLALRTAVFGAAATLILAVTLGGVSSSVGTRLATIGTSLSEPDRSVGDRYALWGTAAAIWRDHPVTGVGPKQFPVYRDSYAPLHLSSGSDVADANLSFRHEPLLSPHSMYLLVLSEQGLIGALGFGALLLGAAVLTWRRTRRVAGPTGPPDARDADATLVSVVAAGVLAWTLLNFIFSDIGGQSTVLTPIVLGVALWWATGADGDGHVRAAA